MIEAVTALRRYRDEVGAKPSAAGAGGTGGGRLRRAARPHGAARALRVGRRRGRRKGGGGGSRLDGDVVASVPIPGGAVQVLPSDAFDAGEARERVEKKRAGLVQEIERAERKLANEQFVAKAPAAVVDEERRKLAEYREALAQLKRTSAWGLTPFAQAEEYLLSLELFGMRFGLDRMHRLMTVLGLPQRRFASIHVVGSNGKSSTVRFAAAILERDGLRTGSYTSPHLRSFRERIEVGEEPVSEADFAAAVTRAAQAAELVNRTAEPDDHVTQFEALTAAAYHELARRGVEVAVIEAGLGGRFDATNVIPSKVQVLTSVSLEHTRWLGPTLEDIAREKLAVVHDHGTLVVGALPPEVRAIAEEVAAERHARLVRREPRPSCRFARPAASRTGISALAAAAAEAFLGRPVEERALRAAAAETVVPGRLEAVGERPLTLFDGAHNPSGAHALASSLPDVFGPRRPRVAVVGVLEDKDAAGMLEKLLPQLDRVVFTRPANPRSLSPATLVTLAEKLGGPPAETVAEPAGGARPRARARRPGRRRARHGLDLPDRRPRARGRRRAGVDAVVPVAPSARSSSTWTGCWSSRARRRSGSGWAGLRNGIGEEELRSAMHGVRSVEVVRALRPGLDAVAEAGGIEEAQARGRVRAAGDPWRGGGAWGVEGGGRCGRDLGHAPARGRAARRGGHRAAGRDGHRRTTCRAGSRTRRAT